MKSSYSTYKLYYITPHIYHQVPQKFRISHFSAVFNFKLLSSFLFLYIFCLYSHLSVIVRINKFPILSSFNIHDYHKIFSFCLSFSFSLKFYCFFISISFFLFKCKQHKFYATYIMTLLPSISSLKLFFSSFLSIKITIIIIPLSIPFLCSFQALSQQLCMQEQSKKHS